MKYTADLFLLPDGSPMDPQEIASMLNNWAGAPDIVDKSKQIKNTFTPSGRYITVPIRTGRFFAGPIDGSSFPENSSIVRHEIPVYTENMCDVIDRYVSNYYRAYGIQLEQIGVGYDIYYNLKESIIRRNTVLPITEHPDGLFFMCSVGQIRIFCIETAGEIIPLHDRGHINE